MHKITVEQIMARNPCPEYPKSRVHELIGNGKKPLEILDLPIPPEDRLWVVLHPSILSDKDLRLFACDCAERALTHVENPPQASLDAVAVARRYANGEATQEELQAADAAAWGAAYAAAWAVARAAAYAAAWGAAYAAAWAAARAADAAAWAAARAADAAKTTEAARAADAAKTTEAARAAERKWQIEQVKKYLKGEI